MQELVLWRVLSGFDGASLGQRLREDTFYRTTNCLTVVASRKRESATTTTTVNVPGGRTLQANGN